MSVSASIHRGVSSGKRILSFTSLKLCLACVPRVFEGDERNEACGRHSDRHRAYGGGLDWFHATRRDDEPGGRERPHGEAVEKAHPCHVRTEGRLGHIVPGREDTGVVQSDSLTGRRLEGWRSTESDVSLCSTNIPVHAEFMVVPRPRV